MIRGTTPTHIFKIPFAANKIQKVRVIYAQDDIPVLVKEAADCDIEDGQITIKLSQEDTFVFNCKKTVAIQIRILDTAGEAYASKPINAGVRKCLDTEVIL